MTMWKTANEELLAEQRRRLGAPPTAEEVLALTLGKLSDEEAERLRDRLIAYPELVRTLTAPFPAEEAEVVPFAPRRWQSATAIAAMLAIVLGTLLWRAEERSAAPHVIREIHLLTPDGGRGPAEVAKLSPDGDWVLAVPLAGEQRFEQYRVEIADGAGKRLWRSDLLPQPASDTFTIVVPRAFLRPGTYRVVVNGVADGQEVPLTSFTVRVE